MESRNWFYIHESLAAAELAHRINCWRQNVEVCNTLVTDPTTHNPSLQYSFPCEGLVPPALQTRPRNSRRQKPYARPPDSPSHTRAPMDVSDLPIDVQQSGMSFLDTRQVWGAAERVVGDNGELSGLTTSSKESAGLDLPHPEKNPLVFIYFIKKNGWWLMASVALIDCLPPRCLERGIPPSCLPIRETPCRASKRRNPMASNVFERRDGEHHEIRVKHPTGRERCRICDPV